MNFQNSENYQNSQNSQNLLSSQNFQNLQASRVSRGFWALRYTTQHGFSHSIRIITRQRRNAATKGPALLPHAYPTTRNIYTKQMQLGGQTCSTKLSKLQQAHSQSQRRRFALQRRHVNRTVTCATHRQPLSPAPKPQHRAHARPIMVNTCAANHTAIATN